VGNGATNWEDVISDERLRAGGTDRDELRINLQSFGALTSPPTIHNPPTQNNALLVRLLELCPCLYNQVDTTCSPRGTVHLCEITLNTRITSNNATDAFNVQHPSKGPDYSHPPVQLCRSGGDIMETLCSEVLTNEGIPLMEQNSEGWPIWSMPGHISLNNGKMSSVKAFGDILIPAAPTNIIVSVKSEAARERLLYSANMIEGVGYGFFNQPEEFWTEKRMNLYKRMGFTAIYLPSDTLDILQRHISEEGHQDYAININGKPLYRSLSDFGEDMRSVVGKITLSL